MGKIYCLTEDCSNREDNFCSKFEDQIPMDGSFCAGYIKRGEKVDKNENYIDSLLERLNTVNHITDITSIIDLCREAAFLIKNSETMRKNQLRENELFEKWLKAMYKQNRKD